MYCVGVICIVAKFPNDPLIRVPFFLMFSFNKDTPKQGKEGATGP